MHTAYSVATEGCDLLHRFILYQQSQLNTEDFLFLSSGTFQDVNLAIALDLPLSYAHWGTNIDCSWKVVEKTSAAKKFQITSVFVIVLVVRQKETIVVSFSRWKLRKDDGSNFGCETQHGKWIQHWLYYVQEGQR